MAAWALLLYRMPASPSAPRVAIWRALKRMPGGYVQDGAFAAPATEETQTQLQILAHDIRNLGGQATFLVAERVDDDGHLRRRIAQANPLAAPRNRTRRSKT